MSYAMTRRRRPRMRPKKSALGGILDDIGDVLAGVTGSIGLSSAFRESQCQGQMTAQMATLQTKVDQTDAQWQPSGYYTPDDFKAAAVAAYQLAASAKDALIKAPLPSSDSQQKTMDAYNAITAQTQKGLELTAQYNAAIQQGATVIDSPGLKQYVVDSMQVSYNAIATAAYLTCDMPWLVSVIGTFQTGFDAVWGVVSKIAGVVANVGDLIYHVSGDLTDIWTYAKWIVIIGGAGWVLMQFGKTRRKGAGVST